MTSPDAEIRFAFLATSLTRRANIFCYGFRTGIKKFDLATVMVRTSMKQDHPLPRSPNATG
jgi:hypothetical protein